MFSGHSIWVTVAAIFWLMEKNDHLTQAVMWSAKLICTAFLPAMIWAILANRSHYSMDIMVAIQVSAGCYCAVLLFWRAIIAERNLWNSIRQETYTPILFVK